MSRFVAQNVTPHRAARLKLRMSLAQVDALTGIGTGRLSLLERLPAERLSENIRRRLQHAYNVTEHELLGTAAREVDA